MTFCFLLAEETELARQGRRDERKLLVGVAAEGLEGARSGRVCHVERRVSGVCRMEYSRACWTGRKEDAPRGR